jgi:iron complex transport system substrate-binding protein
MTRFGICQAVLSGAIALLAAWIVLSANALSAPNKPQRIVSLNLCADELVLRLVDRANVASITWLSRDPNNSNIADLAAQIPVNHGLAEEIIPLKPDLVIAGLYTTRTAVALLKRTKTPLMELGVPRNMDEIEAQIRQVASAVGEVKRGEQIIADMTARLGQISSGVPGTRPRALVLNPNGFTTAPGSLVDNIIKASGMVNVADELHLGRTAQVPLEIVVTSDVDILILNDHRGKPSSLATELLQHPVLTKLSAHTQLFALPSRLWTCGGPGVVDAIERLSQIATQVVPGKRPP